MTTATETTPISPELEGKNQQLRLILRGFSRVIVAYSGGVDSAFLLKVAHQELGSLALGIIGVSPSLMPEEHDAAVELATQIGANLRVVETHEMDDENYASNPNNRCYFCKSHLFETLTKIARDENFDAVCDGTNLDDMNEWRPGALAGTEKQIRSPLREVNLTKDEIRQLSRVLDLPTWDKPAMPCLSSRIPYGTPVTIEALRMIGRGEAFLRSRGLREVRVRHFDESGKLTARVEVAPEEMPQLFTFYEELVRVLKDAGYNAILLDLEGYRRGKMNDAITAQPLIQIRI